MTYNLCICWLCDIYWIYKMHGATIKIIHFQYFKCVWNLVSQILGGLWENRVPQRKLLPEWDGGWEGCKNVHDINFVVCLSQKKKVAPPKGALLRVWEFVSNFVYCNYSYDTLYSQTQDKKNVKGQTRIMIMLPASAATEQNAKTYGPVTLGTDKSNNGPPIEF